MTVLAVVDWNLKFPRREEEKAGRIPHFNRLHQVLNLMKVVLIKIELGILIKGRILKNLHSVEKKLTHRVNRKVLNKNLNLVLSILSLPLTTSMIV